MFIWLVCRGTSYGLANRGEYNYLKSLYANCTIIDGNLEIVFIESTQHDFSFLRSIREVMGYVLIVSVFVDVIPLENLRVIRGRTQYQISASTSYYSLFVAINGFTRLPLVSLHGKNISLVCYVEKRQQQVKVFLCWRNFIRMVRKWNSVHVDGCVIRE